MDVTERTEVPERTAGAKPDFLQSERLMETEYKRQGRGNGEMMQRKKESEINI